MKQLDPKFVWLYFFSSLFGVLFSSIFFTIFFSTFLGFLSGGMLFTWIIKAWWVIILVVLILNYIWARLTYSNYSYELRADGFRKEHGVIWKKYVTIPYERIQNVDINRGPLARIFGLSDLHIQTAGMSSGMGSYGGGAEGRLPGLSPEIAEQLRDELIKRARGKNQGL